MKKVAVWVSILALITALGFVLAPKTANASVNDFNFSDFKADYYLSKDDSGRSVMRVVENFTAEFPDFNQNKGVVRAIPLVFDGHPVSVDVKSLTRNGQPEPIYSKEKQNKNLLISTGDDSYVLGPQTYELTYTLRDVTKDLGDHQELYWNVVGLQHSQSFDSVQVSVHLDKSIVGNFNGQTVCYEGLSGSTNKCGITSIDSQTYMYKSNGAIGPNQDMSIVMSFKAGSFEPFQAGLTGMVQSSLVILSAVVSIAGLIFAFVLRFGRGRDAKGSGIIVPEYLPPEQPVRLVADLIKKPTKVVASQIISLAVSHKIRVVESDKKVLFGSSKSYSIELINANGLTPDETEFLGVFFDGMKLGSIYNFDSSDYTVGSSLRHYKSEARILVVNEGYRRTVKSKPFVLLVSVLAIVYAFILSLFEFQYVVEPITVIYGIVVPLAFICLIIVFNVIGSLRPLTDKGRELVDYVSGLEMYIKLAEADRLKVLQSPKGADKTPIDPSDTKRVVKLYERVLPYAVLLGYEKEWAKQLTVYYEQAGSVPSWYVGASAFNAATFASSIGGMSASVTNFSAPPSSGGSGFSGGAGGGGGGGGFGGR